MSIMFKINEIFTSIEGEGIRTGVPCTFIRLHGCNLACSYCDTVYSCRGEDYTEYTLEEIVEKVKEKAVNHITITGGEPLMEQNTLFLVNALLKENFCVNIETNGSYEIQDYLAFENLIITMDYKSLSSNMQHKMKTSQLPLLRKADVLKFVVSNKYDLADMKDILSKYDIKASVYVSPVFGKIEPKEIVEYILENELYQCITQVQLHKIIWDPNKRGV